MREDSLPLLVLTSIREGGYAGGDPSHLSKMLGQEELPPQAVRGAWS